MLPNFDELDSSKVTVKKICGMPVGQIDENHYVACDKEAVGELTFIVPLEPDDVMADGSREIPVNVPVCADCLRRVQGELKVSIQELDTGPGILLD